MGGEGVCGVGREREKAKRTLQNFFHLMTRTWLGWLNAPPIKISVPPENERVGTTKGTVGNNGLKTPKSSRIRKQRWFSPKLRVCKYYGPVFFIRAAPWSRNCLCHSRAIALVNFFSTYFRHRLYEAINTSCPSVHEHRLDSPPHSPERVVTFFPLTMLNLGVWSALF